MKALILLATLALAVPATAQSVADGNKLYNYFLAYERYLATEEPEDQVEASFYVGYITGMRDSTQLRPVVEFCFPPNATVGQLADVTGKYLRENPELRADAGVVIVYGSWLEPFLCGDGETEQP